MILVALLSILIFPVFLFFRSVFLEFGPNLFFYLVSKISGGIIVYIAVDSVLGITLRRLRKGCKLFNKATYIDGHEDILKSFEWLKDKFGVSKVKLYLDPDTKTINAYAVGSFTGSAVIITLGLINHIQNNTSSRDEFVDSVCAILGHEMAHLTNKDFFPGLLISASEAVNFKISRMIRWAFLIISKLCLLIPFFGRPISMLIIASYNMVNSILMAFFRFIFMPIYRFLQKMFSRAIEYRCDRESAYAYGGQKMAKALGMLGKGGYFSLFSTHPATKSRIQAVQGILPKSGTIRPGIINSLSTLISIVAILFVFSFSTKMADIPNMQERFVSKIYHPMLDKAGEYQHSAEEFYLKWKQK